MIDSRLILRLRTCVGYELLVRWTVPAHPYPDCRQDCCAWTSSSILAPSSPRYQALRVGPEFRVQGPILATSLRLMHCKPSIRPVIRPSVPFPRTKFLPGASKPAKYSSALNANEKVPSLLPLHMKLPAQFLLSLFVARINFCPTDRLSVHGIE